MQTQLRYKEFYLFLVFFLLAQTIHAQAVLAIFFGDKISNDKVSVGLFVAGQSSFLTNTGNSKNKFGVAIGAYTDIKLKGKWNITNFMSFKSPKGMEDMPTEYSVVENAEYSEYSRIERKLVYFEIVPMARYNFTPSFSLAAGPEFGIRIKAKDYYIYEREDGSTETVEYNIKDYIDRFDIGAAADLQYILQQGKGIRFNARFCYGFNNIYHDTPLKAFNQYINVGVGIPIGGKKKPE